MSQGAHRLRLLARHERGATLVEFAIVAPVLGFMLLAAFDVAHTLYVRAALQGVVQKAARDLTLESGLVTATQDLLDEKVRKQVKALANNGTVTISRQWYRRYEHAAASQFEPWTDTNSNGTCDGPQGGTPGEPYEDTNGNNRWDATGGNLSQGGAKDAVLYTATVSYPRFFPVYNVIGGSNTTKVTASTILRNQPYGDQGVATVRNCP
ncbi:pilus assembly protein [Sphingomonas sp. BT-65]|uniref:TadE/TadG family type IV pilus assembly protein n=1 Tax=Sphingomonas sp. BT-65 TaxID=2989821 RepID=UPI0022360038|nr:TadE/TadG family type IV pilus assembly protein [Sphingomonas sp. BT-65]MCW4460369.1 pilus assembly protein [Sphingomonas sp. BT-65]